MIEMNRFLNIINWITRILSYAGAIILFGMMMLTTIDVVCRYLFNAPILGVLEITEFMMVCVVFLSLAYAQSNRGHVAVDVLVVRFSRRNRKVFNIINFLVSILILVLIGWNSFGQGLEMMRSGQVSATFSIPVYPFMFLVCLGSIAMALELLKDLIGQYYYGEILRNLLRKTD